MSSRPPWRRSPERLRQIRRRRAVAAAVLLALAMLIAWRVVSCGCGGASGGAALAASESVPSPALPSLLGDGVKVGTFLGDYSRRFYGLGPAPKGLDVLWKVDLGRGWTSGKYDDDPPGVGAGSGWSGQPGVVVDGGKPYVIASGYDYNLRRIDATTGEVVGKYKFDDIIKGSPRVFENPDPAGTGDRYIVLAGSRRGYPYKLADPRVAPYRALTFDAGKELWRLPVPQTECYSRDCDGSGFFYDGVVYIGVESGWYYALDPARVQARRGRSSRSFWRSACCWATSAPRSTTAILFWRRPALRWATASTSPQARGTSTACDART
jgi:hypothetical protein